MTKQFRDIVPPDIRLETVDFPDNQYVQAIYPKKQIVLHHTASGRGAEGDIRYWKSTKPRIATSIVIDWTGVLLQCFNSKYFGYHLGVGGKGNKIDPKYKTDQHWYDKHSIGIEIDAWGQLEYKNGKFHCWTGKEISEDRVVEYPDKFRGFQFYEKYTDAQIRSVEALLLWWNYKYGIPLDYSDAIFDINENALRKRSGVYTHCSYRTDKFDIHPQSEMIAMLKGLKAKI